MLTQEEILNYQQTLEGERVKLMQEMEDSEKDHDFGSDVDSDEKVDEAEEISNQVGMQDVIRDRVNAIDKALNKIASHEYGVCERCKNPIGKDVLDIVPESALCVDCKKKEAEEKLDSTNSSQAGSELG